MNYTKIFYTVPLGNRELVRADDGSKTGMVFPKEGWTKYITNQNDSNTALLAGIARQDFIGLDFDTDEGFNTALSLDEDCAYVAKSDKKGGHLLYRYSEGTQLQKTRVPNVIDVQMNESLIYLATPANKTKTLLTPPLKTLNCLTEMPLPMKLYVENLILKYKTENLASFTQSSSNLFILESSTLGYLLKDITPTSPYKLEIFKQLTPKKYKPSLLHPRDIPKGEGTRYLQAIITKLALDVSVNEIVLRNTMHWVNNLMGEDRNTPKSAEEIEQQCYYQIHKATINGQRAWVYNEDWDKKGLIIKDKYLSAIEYFYDVKNAKFLEFNRTTKDIIIHQTSGNAKNSYISKQKLNTTVPSMITRCEEIEIISDPTEESYYIEGKSPFTSKFNTYVPALGTKILRDPSLVENPKKPEYILSFLENLIPNKMRRQWLLQFIKHKHTTYDYSPIYIVFAGVGGAGKGVFLDIIMSFFSGVERIQEIDLDKLQNNFNAWKVNTDYVHLDEAGESSTTRETAQIVAELKKLTGSSMVSVQYKGKDVTGDDTQRHYITPILHTNMNDIKFISDLPANDRRFVYIECPNKMTKVSNGDDSKLVSLMRDELPHFAHYLATQVPKINIKDYNSNESQKDEDYENFIHMTIDPHNMLADAVELQDLQKFIKLLQQDFGVSDMAINKIFDSRLQAKGTSRIALYNTRASDTLHMTALLDVAETNDLMDTMKLKKLLGRRKGATTILGDKGERIKVIYLEFKGTFVPLSEISASETVEDIEI